MMRSGNFMQNSRHLYRIISRHLISRSILREEGARSAREKVS